MEVVRVTTRILAWVGGIALVIAVGLGVYIGVAGLNKTGPLLGVVTALVGLVGVAVAAYAALQAHKDAAATNSAKEADGQAVINTTAGGVNQIKGVDGSVHVSGTSVASSNLQGRSVAADQADVSRPPSEAYDGGQKIINSELGYVTQIDSVGKDVDIDL